MSDEKPPLIELAFKDVLCPRHGQPFRAKWPQGYLVFALSGLRRVMAQDEVFEASGGNVEKVRDLLGQKPICCRLSPDELLELYTLVNGETGLWPAGLCVNCKQLAPGGPYRVLNHWGREKEYSHICLECVVKRMGPPLQAN